VKSARPIGHKNMSIGRLRYKFMADEKYGIQSFQQITKDLKQKSISKNNIIQETSNQEVSKQDINSPEVIKQENVTNLKVNNEETSDKEINKPEETVITEVSNEKIREQKDSGDLKVSNQRKLINLIKDTYPVNKSIIDNKKQLQSIINLYSQNISAIKELNCDDNTESNEIFWTLKTVLKSLNYMDRMDLVTKLSKLNPKVMEYFEKDKNFICEYFVSKYARTQMTSIFGETPNREVKKKVNETKEKLNPKNQEIITKNKLTKK